MEKLEVVEMIHITSAEIALKIIHGGVYKTDKPQKNYDAGMNFLGVLGECANTMPTNRGCEIHCEWHGEVSDPFPYYANDYHTENILYDFNGSGNHFKNKDPRYFLPCGSKGLIVRKIVLEGCCNKKDLIDWWCSFKGKTYVFINKMGFFKKRLLQQVIDYIEELNEKLEHENVTISVIHEACGSQ